MVDVRRRKCGQKGCIKWPTFGFEGGKKQGEFCREHSKQDMINLVSRKCCHNGCTTQPSYSVDGSKKPEYCRKHSSQGMVNVQCKRCGHSGCAKQPTFGAPQSRKREFCRDHTKSGMVNVKSKPCRRGDCTRQPFYGVEGSKKPEYCREHAMVNMVNVRHKSCDHSGCNKRASFGVDGSRKPEFCREHCQHGMVNVRWRKSGEIHGTKPQLYGADESNEQKVCLHHSKGSMVNVKDKRCDQSGSTQRLSSGVKGSKKPNDRRGHVKDRMADVDSRRCGEGDCARKASHRPSGVRTRQSCWQHTKDATLGLIGKGQPGGKERHVGRVDCCGDAAGDVAAHTAATGTERDARSTPADQMGASAYAVRGRRTRARRIADRSKDCTQVADGGGVNGMGASTEPQTLGLDSPKNAGAPMNIACKVEPWTVTARRVSGRRHGEAPCVGESAGVLIGQERGGIALPSDQYHNCWDAVTRRKKRARHIAGPPKGTATAPVDRTEPSRRTSTPPQASNLDADENANARESIPCKVETCMVKIIPGGVQAGQAVGEEPAIEREKAGPTPGFVENACAPVEAVPAVSQFPPLPFPPREEAMRTTDWTSPVVEGGGKGDCAT